MYWEAGSVVSFPLRSLYPLSPISRIFELHVVLPFTEFTPSYFIEYSMYDSLVSCRLRIASKRKSKANFHRKWFRTCLSEKIPILCISFRGVRLPGVLRCPFHSGVWFRGVLFTTDYDSAVSSMPGILTMRSTTPAVSCLLWSRTPQCFKTWTVVVWIRISRRNRNQKEKLRKPIF